MKWNPEEYDRLQNYRLFTSIIVPRPIAWVSTLNEDGSHNAAPFSFFMGVSSNPPRLAISVARRSGERKDTTVNILRSREFVVNVVTESNAEAMNLTSGDYPYGTDELEIAGLTTLSSEKISAPRIAEAPVNLECIFEKHVEFADAGTDVIFGRVLIVHIDDSVMTDGSVDPEKLGAVGRLGIPFYNRVNDIFTMERPNLKDK